MNRADLSNLAGPIGLLAAYLVRYSGASQLLIAERSETRRNYASQMGFETLPPDKIPNGAFNVVLECAGAIAAMRLAVEVTRPGGTIVWLGVVHPDAEVSIRPYELFRRERTSFAPSDLLAYSSPRKCRTA
jgi:threonine dehydrogenase-like Zn-dependent dehydrogenase